MMDWAFMIHVYFSIVIDRTSLISQMGINIERVLTLVALSFAGVDEPSKKSYP